jgi:hypothetical protein
MLRFTPVSKIRTDENTTHTQTIAWKEYTEDEMWTIDFVSSTHDK